MSSSDVNILHFKCVASCHDVPWMMSTLFRGTVAVHNLFCDETRSPACQPAVTRSEGRYVFIRQDLQLDFEQQLAKKMVI